MSLVCLLSLGLRRSRLVLGVFKLRIALVIGLTALFGWFLRTGNLMPAGRALALCGGIMALSAAAGAYNQISERDLDARMNRTRSRPFVTGALKPGLFWYLAIALVALTGFAVAAVAGSWLGAVLGFLGAFTYAVIYTSWLKRRTVLNIVIGGLAGSFAVVAGGAAAAAPGPAFTPLVLAFAWILFLWTPPHFWSLALACHDDYAAAGVPMLPVVVGASRTVRIIWFSTWALVLSALLPLALGLGLVYALAAVGLGAWFVWQSFRLVQEPTRAVALRNFAVSLVYLVGLMLAVILDQALWHVSLGS